MAIIGDENAGCDPAPSKGTERPMRRRSKPHTFDDRLNEEKARLEARLEAIEPGPQRKREAEAVQIL